jgi:hypothetical protein
MWIAMNGRYIWFKKIIDAPCNMLIEINGIMTGVKLRPDATFNM